MMTDIGTFGLCAVTNDAIQLSSSGEEEYHEGGRW